jgi:hypothetical protein
VNNLEGKNQCCVSTICHNVSLLSTSSPLNRLVGNSESSSESDMGGNNDSKKGSGW